MPAPTRSPRLFPALLAAVVLAGLVVSGAQGAASAATAPAARVAPQAAVAVPVHDDLDLRGDAHEVTNGSARRASYAWTGHRITYFEAMPAAWDWSLQTAVEKWNSAGGGIRFVKTTVRSRAQLTIGFGNIGTAAGMATVGRTRNAWVRLNPVYRNADAVDTHNRVEVMAIFTHELGHVLGFEHTAGRCTTMSAMLDVDGCGVVAAAAPGYYRCRTIDTSLLARFVRLYGGRARAAAGSQCLIDPVPSALPDLTFDSETSSPVAIRWARPTAAPTGSMVAIRYWSADSCQTTPASADAAYADPASTRWQDPAATDEHNCFRVQLVNRYGVGPAAVVTKLQRAVLPGPVEVPTAPEDTPAAPEVAEVP